MLLFFCVQGRLVFLFVASIQKSLFLTPKIFTPKILTPSIFAPKIIPLCPQKQDNNNV